MISEYLGIDSDYIVIGLAALVLILIIVMIVNAAKMHSLKKAYNNFMTGKDAKNLEDTILKRLDQVEQLMDNAESVTLLPTILGKCSSFKYSATFCR